MGTYNNAQTASLGVHAVGYIVAAELGWIFREQTIHDNGIEAHIELCSCLGNHILR